MIAILLSTYNGSCYIRQQLDSLLQQTVKEFALYIRDDGSTDDTLEIVRSYHDSRIVIGEGENIGPSLSFFELLRTAKATGADYAFFCDQDDIWHSDKIKQLMTGFSSDANTPELVFSDFSTIDENGMILHDSFFESAKIRIPTDGNFFPKLLAQPYAFGCATAINRSLIDLLQDPPNGIEMYDCWISLIASLFGRVRFLPKKTIQHRLHACNATGKVGQDSVLNRIKRISTGFSEQCKNTTLRLFQVNLLLQCYETILPDNAVAVLNELSEGIKKSSISAVKTLYKAEVSRGGFFQNLLFMLTVLAYRRDSSCIQ